MTGSSVTLKHLFHENGHQIGLYFAYDAQLIDIIKKINGMKWSKSK